MHLFHGYKGGGNIRDEPTSDNLTECQHKGSTSKLYQFVCMCVRTDQANFPIRYSTIFISQYRTLSRLRRFCYSWIGGWTKTRQFAFLSISLSVCLSLSVSISRGLPSTVSSASSSSPALRNTHRNIIFWLCSLIMSFYRDNSLYLRTPETEAGRSRNDSQPTGYDSLPYYHILYQ